MLIYSTKKKIAPVIITVIVVAYVAPLLGMVAYAAGLAGTQGAGAAVPFLLLYALVGGAVIVGVVYAMAQRLREIDGGEEDEASKY
ncbi:MAG: hypothetical protein K2O84_05070 [Oscillospiraceae bacterium]|nr:hypothetical protein [Oscillospiraceae bacterium]